MKLHTSTSGHGDRFAVLLHGFNCDSGDWWEVAPALVSRGYHVVALDLRGHGLSPRATHYRLADFVSDVEETWESSGHHRHPELLIGHSLGATIAALAAERLNPDRVILLDPPWSPISDETRAGLFPDLASVPRLGDGELESTLRAQFPRWSDEAIRADIASWRRWDPASEEVIDDLFGDSIPPRPFAPSLIVAADPSVVLLPPQQRQAHDRGFDVRVATGLSHSLFRDDVTSFLRTLEGWL